jgi:nitrite reductase/ring-hydroxylating ferredoxin subunit
MNDDTRKLLKVCGVAVAIQNRLQTQLSEAAVMVGHIITLKGGNTMSKLVKIAETKDVAPGTGKVVEAEGRSIALFNVAGTFHAIDNTCTHEGGPLGEGELSSEVVTCPWHNTEFNVKTGEALGPLTDEGVRSFAVKVQGNDVLVELD